jgi:hypothetical protein
MGNIIPYKETSNWAGDLGCMALASSLVVPPYAGSFCVLLIDDLNARPGSFTPSSTTLLENRRILNRLQLGAGMYLIRLCTDYDLVCIGGAEFFGSAGGNFTSFHCPEIEKYGQ